MKTTAQRLLFCTSLLVLGGCDNFRQRVTAGPWQPVASDEPAVPDERSATPISLVEIASGAGRTIEAGDLVRLRYARRTSGADKVERTATPPQEAWLWTGREPDVNLDLAGNFGSPELRAALIGRRVGDRIELRVLKPYAEIKVPRYAIAGPQSPRRGLNEFIGQYDALISLQLAGGEFAWGQQARSEIEIVAACPAQFYVRNGHMEQWGYVINMFGTAWDTQRHGSLRWSAIEAQCPPPDGRTRFMLGPIYWRAEPWVRNGLMSWQEGYQRERPRTRYPDDYAFVTVHGHTLPSTAR